MISMFAHDRILDLLVSLERFQILYRLKVCRSAGDRLGDMLQVVFNALGVLHRGSACCRTLSRNFDGNPFGVDTDTVTPSNCPASICNLAMVNKLVDSVGSTSKSRSLSSVSVPVKTEPK